MKLLNLNGHSFIPMLEYYFQSEIEVETITSIDRIYRSIQTKRFSKSKDNLTIEVNLYSKKLGKLPQEYINTDYLLITEVSEVILLINGDTKLSEKTVLLTTLRTHIDELKKSLNNLCIYLPFENKELNNLPDPKYSSEVVLVNPPTITLKDEEYLNCKAIVISYVDCYNPDDHNYANEYNEIYHLARILKVPVYTAVTETELNYLKFKLNGK